MTATGFQELHAVGSDETAATSLEQNALDRRLLGHLKTLPRNRRPNMHAVKDALGVDRMVHIFASMDRLYARELIDKRGLPVVART